MKAEIVAKMKAIRVVFPDDKDIGTWWVCDDWDGFKGAWALPTEPYVVGSVEVNRVEKGCDLDIYVLYPYYVAKIDDDYVVGTLAAIEAYCRGDCEKQRFRIQRGDW